MIPMTTVCELFTGGRHGVHRCLLATSLATAFVAVLAGAPTGQALRVHEAPAVMVHETDGIYIVNASFAVAAAPAAVLRVLTNYDAIPRVVPDVLTSVVVSRRGADLVVEQVAVSRLLFFSRTVQLRLHVRETSEGLEFSDVGRRSFALYEGGWRVKAQPWGSAVTYHLRAQPSFDVPEFLIKRVLKRDAGQMIDRLRKAMVS